MVFHVSGKNDGNGRMMTKKLPKARPNKLIGSPHFPRRNGACVGISPCHLLIMKNVIGMRYDKYKPTVDRDRIALRATVDPRLISMSNAMIILASPRALVGIRRVG